MYQCWPVSGESFKRYWADNICTKTGSLASTVDHVSWYLILNRKLSLRNGVKRYWADTIFTKTCSLTLTFDPLTWKIGGYQYRKTFVSKVVVDSFLLFFFLEYSKTSIYCWFMHWLSLNYLGQTDTERHLHFVKHPNLKGFIW